MKLALVDLEPTLGPELVAAFETVAASPRERVQGLRIRHDWRDVGVRFLQKKFPKLWIYRGGRHLAIHASPPPVERHNLKLGERQDLSAGRCLARIIEVRTPSEARDAHKNRIAGQSALPVSF
jgi:hypothetical protein